MSKIKCKNPATCKGAGRCLISRQLTTMAAGEVSVKPVISRSFQQSVGEHSPTDDAGGGHFARWCPLATMVCRRGLDRGQWAHLSQ